MVTVKIIEDSVDNKGNRITSYLATFTQTIVKEVLRHRMFSFSSSSMRAIPAHKVLEALEEEFYIPTAWQKKHSGMQGKEYFKPEDTFKEDGYDISYINRAEYIWENAKDASIDAARELLELGVTKQNGNRLIETFGNVNLLMTTTEVDNFFELRCPLYYYEPEDKYFYSKKDFINHYKKCFEVEKDFFDKWTVERWLEINHSQAEIHVQELAEAMWDARNESIPKKLKEGEWHIPFGDRMDEEQIAKISSRLVHKIPFGVKSKVTFIKLLVSAARCARLSYNTFDGKIDYEKDMQLAFMLIEDAHWSPFEHSAQCMTEEEYKLFVRAFIDRNTGNIFLQEGWLANFRGFKQFRQML